MSDSYRHITVIRDDSDHVATTEVSGEMTVGDLKSVIAEDIGLAADQQTLLLLGRELATDTQPLSGTGLEDASLLTAARKRPRPPPSQPPPQLQQQGQQPAQRGAEIEALRQQALTQPAALEQMRQQWPDLAAAVNEPARFAPLLEQALAQQQQQRERMAHEMEFMEANPTADNQQKILDQIRLQQVEENRQAALENLPMGNSPPSRTKTG